MNTKLTLNIDDNVIEQAKSYAKSHRVSLSKLIENYLLSLTKSGKEKPDVSPLVESLTGVISAKDGEFKKEHSDYLAKKYS